jgi:integral membrane protein
VTPRLFFRTVAIAEAITWTLLIAGMILKYGLDAGDIWVRIGGSIHGFVFIAYAMSSVLIGVNQRWKPGLIVLGVVTAVIPYATIPFDIWLDRSGRLDGPWRRVAGDDPRDAHWINRLLRWMLNHPVILILIFVVALVAIFAALLIAGPPVPKG